MNLIFTSNDPLTTLVSTLNIKDWNELTTHILNLPYGRNENRNDFSLVLKEQKGTCSSKHALLKKIAMLNNFSEIKLILGIYRMNAHNTPKIGDVIKNSILNFVPEAHCYIKVGQKRFDYTNAAALNCEFEKELLTEIEVLPEQVVEFKIKHHQGFLKKWIKEEDIALNFDQVWKIREQCIEEISKSN